jgi:hypothetical protein
MDPRELPTVHFPPDRRDPATAVRVRLAPPGRSRRLAPVLAALLLFAALAPASLPARAASPPASVRAAEEKQRVPKPPPEQPRTKPDPDAKGSSSGSSGSDGDDEDFMTGCLESCLAGCFEGFFDAVFESIFHPHRAALVDSAAIALADTSAFADSLGLAASLVPADSTAGADSLQSLFPSEAPRAWTRLDVGYLWTHFPGDSVVLRRGPSGPDSIQMEAGRLPADARVLVTSVRATGGGTMLEVRPVDVAGPAGWVHEKSVGVEPRWGPAAPASGPDTSLDAAVALADSAAGLAAAPAAAPPHLEDWQLARIRMRERIAAERWGLAFAIGPAYIDNPGLAEEYANPAAAVELEYLRYLEKRPWMVGLAAGYRGFAGEPKVEYRGPAVTDVPYDSHFQLGFATLEFGHRHAWETSIRAGYMIGPAVAYVREQAEVQVLDSETRAPLGLRHEELGRWAGGGGGQAWFGAALPIPLELTFRVRFLGLAWSGHHEKSLTSDYTDEGLLHVDLSLVFTYTGR